MVRWKPPNCQLTERFMKSYESFCFVLQIYIRNEIFPITFYPQTIRFLSSKLPRKLFCETLFIISLFLMCPSSELANHGVLSQTELSFLTTTSILICLNCLSGWLFPSKLSCDKLDTKCWFRWPSISNGCQIGGESRLIMLLLCPFRIRLVVVD